MGRLINPGLGEKLDRCTILELKIGDADAARMAPFAEELAAIKGTLPGIVVDVNHVAYDPLAYPTMVDGVDKLHGVLSEVNLQLWEAEDRMRLFRTQKRDVSEPELITIGRLGMQCQKLNDQRAEAIAQINALVGDIWWEKV